MEDLVQFIEKRRKCFKNSCLSLEPLRDWLWWGSANGTLFHSKTSDELFDSIGIAWRVNSGNHINATTEDFIEGFNPFLVDNYDLFVLDFFAENREARNALLTKIILSNMKYKNAWAVRYGKTVKIPQEYVTKLYNI